MLLSAEHNLGDWLRAAFMVFAGFWVVVLVALYVGIGILLKRADHGKH